MKYFFLAPSDEKLQASVGRGITRHLKEGLVFNGISGVKSKEAIEGLSQPDVILFKSSSTQNVNDWIRKTGVRIGNESIEEEIPAYLVEGDTFIGTNGHVFGDVAEPTPRPFPMISPRLAFYFTYVTQKNGRVDFVAERGYGVARQRGASAEVTRGGWFEWWKVFSLALNSVLQERGFEYRVDGDEEGDIDLYDKAKQALLDMGNMPLIGRAVVVQDRLTEKMFVIKMSSIGYYSLLVDLEGKVDNYKTIMEEFLFDRKNV